MRIATENYLAVAKDFLLCYTFSKGKPLLLSQKHCEYHYGDEKGMKAREAAKLFIQLGNIQAESNSGDGMTNLRLNKLLYFAQGQALSKLDRPLFDEQIEAWDLGPVVASVYHSYKGFGKNPIEDVPPQRESFSDEEYMLLLDVYNAARSMSTSELVNISHKTDAPWDVVYNQKDDKGGVIEREVIRDYFIAHPFCKRTFMDVVEKMKEKAYTPKRDENGVPIIPKEIAYGWE